MKKAFTMIRVSGKDQLKGYGPDSQWYDDVLPNARLLELEVSETLRRVIQEPATGWDRGRFQEAIREALGLYQRREIQAVLFPRWTEKPVSFLAPSPSCARLSGLAWRSTLPGSTSGLTLTIVRVFPGTFVRQKRLKRMWKP